MQKTFKPKTLQGDALEWAKTAMAIGLDLDHTVRIFLQIFPDYQDPNSYETDADEVAAEQALFNNFRTRFRKMRTDTRRVSYFQIKEKREDLKKFLDAIPIASPIVRLIELERMRADTTLKPGEKIKVIAAADKIMAALLHEGDRNKFNLMPPFSPVEGGNSKDTSKVDSLGGALMNNVDTGQETE